MSVCAGKIIKSRSRFVDFVVHEMKISSWWIRQQKKPYEVFGRLIITFTVVVAAAPHRFKSMDIDGYDSQEAGAECKW